MHQRIRNGKTEDRKDNEKMTEKLRKQKRIRDLKADDIVNDLFVVRSKRPVQEYAKGYRFELRIGDASGEMMLKYWGDDDKEFVEKIYDSIKEDNVIYVTGRIGEFQGNLDISINKERPIKVCSPEEYVLSDFILTSDKDVEKMFEELKSVISNIREPTLQKILNYFFSREDLIKEFKLAPAAMYKHHGWLGGLLEHVLEMINIAEGVMNAHPGLNKELLLTGVILHDIGKVKSFELTTSIKYSKGGMLKGDIIIGYEMFSKAITELGISENEESVVKLSHMILSHHGKLEYGSPKLPAFPEAMALYKIDELNARLKNMITTKNNAVTEDDFIYTKDFGNIYLK